MVLRSAILILVLGACTEAQPAGASGNPGKDLYENRCAECHGIKGDGQLAGSADLTVSKLTQTELRTIIENGKNGMPPFKLIINTDSLMQETMEYVISLRKQ